MIHLKNIYKITKNWNYAAKLTSLNPAKMLNISSLYGSIVEGKIANLLIIDEKDLTIKKIYNNGFLL